MRSHILSSSTLEILFLLMFALSFSIESKYRAPLIKKKRGLNGCTFMMFKNTSNSSQRIKAFPTYRYWLIEPFQLQVCTLTKVKSKQNIKAHWSRSQRCFSFPVSMKWFHWLKLIVDNKQNKKEKKTNK